MILKTGELYYTAKLQHEGWTKGDGTGADGYFWEAYFQDSSRYDLTAEDTLLRYLGPDCHGIEPTFEAESASEA